MSAWLIALSLLGGLAVLTAGAEGLVRGASRLALLAGVSRLVVGLTVVAYGTSTPELVVSVKAGLAGTPDIALGNVVGSNVFNILFILGVSGLVAPLSVARQLVRFDVPIMIALSFLLWGMALDRRIGPLDGLVLVALMVGYTAWTLRRSRREERARRAEAAASEGGAAAGEGPPARRGREIVRGLLLVAVGLVLLVVGGGWFVDGAVALARAMGVSDLVVGLTIVAAGTSMPEVATSVVATLRGERDIAIGNVIGSNVYNVVAIVGISSLVTGGGLEVADAIVDFDLPVMTAVAVACLPICFTGYSITRIEALVFLGLYGAYTGYLVLAAQAHDALPAYSAVVMKFVLPVTALGIGLSLWRALRERRGVPGATPNDE